MNKLITAALLASSLLIAAPAFADCAGGTLKDAQRRYENGKTFERQGEKERALMAFAAAQGYFCEQVNPYEADAAHRAAALGTELGAAAEKKGDFDKAFQLYEAGGQFGSADRMLVQLARTNPDDAGAFRRALDHFRSRTEGAFAANRAAALKETGPYTPDAKLVAEVNAMPPKAIERGFQKEAAAFNEQYLRDYVQLIQGRTDDATDATSLQRSISAHQAFNQKWKGEDLIKSSLSRLDSLHTWSTVVPDESLAQSVVTRIVTISEQRANALQKQYSGAPKLLDQAMDYYRTVGRANGSNSDDPKVEGRVGTVRTLARKLADEANGKKRFQLASEYYEVAGDNDAAQAARDSQQQAALARMQPTMDQMRKQAEAIQKQFSDPAQIEAMRQQAEAARKAIEQQKAAGGTAGSRKSAEDLEKELGL